MNDKVDELSLNYKFAAWAVFDAIHKDKTYKKLMKQRESKIKSNNRNKEEDEDDDQHKHSIKKDKTDELALISTKIMYALESNQDLSSAASVIVNQELSFASLAASDWRDPILNMVPEKLREIWISLSHAE